MSPPTSRGSRVVLLLAYACAQGSAFSLGGAEMSARRRGASVRAAAGVPAVQHQLLQAIEGAGEDLRWSHSSSSCWVMRAGTPTMQTGGQKVDLDKGSFGGGSGGTATLEDTDFSVNTILKQLESIQQGTPKNIVILGTRHCSFLHQQIIELLSYALVLSDNHIFTSGASGTHAAAIRGALRAENPELLTVILPQTVGRQPREIRELLGQVEQLIELGHDELPLDAASRICNSELLSKGDQVRSAVSAG